MSILTENIRWKSSESIHERFIKEESTYFPFLAKVQVKDREGAVVSERLHLSSSKLHRQILKWQTDTILQPLLLLASGYNYLNLCLFNTSRVWLLDYHPPYSICKILAGGISNQQLLKSAWIIFKIEEMNIMTTQTYDCFKLPAAH